MTKTKVTVEETLTPELEELLASPSPKPRHKAGQTKRGYAPEEDKEFVASYMKMQFVQELREAMQTAGVNSSELARRTGKSRQAVSQTLDQTNPDNFTIEKMAELVCAVGARVSLKVHQPGEMCVTVPVESRPVPVVMVRTFRGGGAAAVDSEFGGQRRMLELSAAEEVAQYGAAASAA